MSSEFPEELQQNIEETTAQKNKRLSDEKANNQLRQNRRTASHQLNRNITFSLLIETGRHTCCRCSKDLTAETFSIDHMENWLDSRDPRGLFFDVKNIDFSCKSCNSFYNRGKFGTRDIAKDDPQFIGIVRKPLFTLEDLKAEEKPQTTKISLLQKIKDLLTSRISWTE